MYKKYHAASAVGETHRVGLQLYVMLLYWNRCVENLPRDLGDMRYGTCSWKHETPSESLRVNVLGLRTVSDLTLECFSGAFLLLTGSGGLTSSAVVSRWYWNHQPPKSVVYRISLDTILYNNRSSHGNLNISYWTQAGETSVKVIPVDNVLRYVSTSEFSISVKKRF
jgi:hypothetical protein